MASQSIILINRCVLNKSLTLTEIFFTPMKYFLPTKYFFLQNI